VAHRLTDTLGVSCHECVGWRRAVKNVVLGSGGVGVTVLCMGVVAVVGVDVMVVLLMMVYVVAAVVMVIGGGAVMAA